MSGDILLYWGSGSPHAWKAQIVLEEKGVKYESKRCDFGKKENKSEEVLKLNPRGQVPTFRHGNLVINESHAICDYLEEVFGSQGNKLVPDDVASKAQVLQRKYEANNLLVAGLVQVAFYQFSTPKEKIDEELLKTKKEKLSAELKVWEGYLEQNGEGAYIVGKSFTMADVFVYPFLALMVRMGLKLDDKYPNLHAYHDRVKVRPSVDKTWPPHWREAPPSSTIFAGV